MKELNLSAVRQLSLYLLVERILRQRFDGLRYERRALAVRARRFNPSSPPAACRLDEVVEPGCAGHLRVVPMFDGQNHVSSCVDENACFIEGTVCKFQD